MAKYFLYLKYILQCRYFVKLHILYILRILLFYWRKFDTILKITFILCIVNELRESIKKNYFIAHLVAVLWKVFAFCAIFNIIRAFVCSKHIIPLLPKVYLKLALRGKKSLYTAKFYNRFCNQIYKKDVFLQF